MNLRGLLALYYFRGGVALREFCGRKVLMATPPAADTWQAIGAVLDEVISDFAENVRQIGELYWFYRGDQPILDRVKDIRAEINNKVVENRAAEVVFFKQGYEFSHPVIYTNAGQNDSVPIDKLNTLARIDGKEEKDLELSGWFYISGTAYRICLPNKSVGIDDAPYFTVSLDPRSAFVVYSCEVGRRPICAGNYAKEKNASGGEQYRIGVYTDTKYYEWVLPYLGEGFAANAPVAETRNGIGKIPIIEYPLNESRLGYVEVCYSLYNAINTLNSNRIDGIEQFIQALMVYVNCELPEDEDNPGHKKVPRTGDAIELKGDGADVKYLIAQLDQQQTQVTKEDLLGAIYEICGIPDRQSRNQGGGDTGQAVVLRNGWGAAEARAMSTEKMYRRAEYEYLKIVLKICRDTQGVDVGNMTLHDIGIAFTRNRSDAMQTKAQTLKMLLDAQVNPEDAYEVSELFSDSVAVWNKSKNWQESQQVSNGQQAVNNNSTAAPGEGDKLNGATEEL